MKYYFQVAVPVPLNKLFDYTVDADTSPAVGVRVLVSFANRKLVGVVWKQFKEKPSSQYKIKPILEILDDKPILNKEQLQLIQWLSDYYHHPIGETCASFLPNLLAKGKPAEVAFKKDQKELSASTKDTELALNSEQKEAVNAINSSDDKFQTYLLEGITGSGKTEVYLQSIKNILEKGQQALVLIPEISLTPQTVTRFQNRFGEICQPLHSKMTNKKRLNAWLQAKEGKVKIIVGTRSSIFTPFQNLGIIIVDEEHDTSFKQQDGLRYSARDLAIYRAKHNNIPIVLGSATPALESLHNANKNQYKHLKLLKRATGAPKSIYHVLDLRNKKLEEGLSERLIKEAKKHLSNGKQVLFFLNRRGYAPVMLCHECGWSAECRRCNMPMTLHLKKRKLICHHCELVVQQPIACPQCQSQELLPIGMGTERLEKVLEKHFPKTEVIRVDRDTVQKKDELKILLDKIHEGGPKILLGTQMLAKGHHFSNVTMVGILNTDQSFYSSDFRAIEKTGQLILQVAGRAGREETPGEVFIQTHQPDHPLLLELIHKGYASFSKALLEERKQCNLPPYSYFAVCRAEAMDAVVPIEFLSKIKAPLNGGAQLLGPIASSMPKRAGRYRAQLLITSNARKSLHQTVKQLIQMIEGEKLSRKVRWSIDIDPSDLY